MLIDSSLAATAPAARFPAGRGDLEIVRDPAPPASDLAPEALIRWGAERFGGGLVMSTSFGIQSAVMLHMATREVPDIPVVWVDTGYLPPETYRFAETLRDRLALNLQAVQPRISPARMEALHGRLWESGERADLDLYDRLRKVEPMQRALRGLDARAWISGIRAQQTAHRRRLERVGSQDGRVKISPILDWTSRDVHAYLTRHDLPYHPLFDQGYASVGDWHSSRPLTASDGDERDTRFGGVKQECGIHLELTPDQAESLESSML